jgi:hypothetical protein
MQRGIQNHEMEICRGPALAIPAQVVDFFIRPQAPADLPLHVSPVRLLESQWTATHDLQVSIAVDA